MNLLNLLGKKNALTPLKIKTYDGGNQGLHPKVLYFDNKFGGYHFWMVMTPYKNMNERIENPCIYFSNNGYDFQSIEGNPIAEINDVSIEYNSDPHLVYNEADNLLECWWRWVGRDNHPILANTEVIYRKKSMDGIHWGDKEQCYSAKSNNGTVRAAISPVIMYRDKYQLWISNSEDSAGEKRRIIYLESDEKLKFEVKNIITLEGFKPSHFDVVFHQNLYYLIFFDVSKVGFPYYCTVSTDNLNYNAPKKIMSSGLPLFWDDGRLYRPSLTIMHDNLRLYYSAYSRRNSCRIGIADF